MKKAMNAIKDFVLAIMGVILVVLCGIFAILVLPLDYRKYKRSLYYKKERRKYSLFAASGNHFALYNEILKHGLPIRYVENPNNGSLECGWFAFEDILILLDPYGLEFDCKNSQWVFREDGETNSVMTLDELIRMELEGVNEFTGREICKYAVVLMDESCISDREKANADKRMLFYNDDRPEVLKHLCEDPRKWRDEK